MFLLHTCGAGFSVSLSLAISAGGGRCRGKLLQVVGTEGRRRLVEPKDPIGDQMVSM